MGGDRLARPVARGVRGGGVGPPQEALRVDHARPVGSGRPGAPGRGNAAGRPSPEVSVEESRQQRHAAAIDRGERGNHGRRRPPRRSSHPSPGPVPPKCRRTPFAGRCARPAGHHGAVRPASAASTRWGTRLRATTPPSSSTANAFTDGGPDVDAYRSRPALLTIRGSVT